MYPVMREEVDNLAGIASVVQYDQNRSARCRQLVQELVISRGLLRLGSGYLLTRHTERTKKCAKDLRRPHDFCRIRVIST